MLQLTPAPQALIDACGGFYTGQDTTPRVTDAVDVNQDNAMSRGIAYVRELPAAESGERNHKGFAVAAQLRDFGVDRHNADVLLQLWNDTKVLPPLDTDELKHVLNSAFQYAHNAPGCLSAESEFTDLSTQSGADSTRSGAPASPPMRPVTVKEFDAAALPKRHWILGRHLLGQKVTELIAPPSAGKSIFAMQMALAVATGREDILNMPVHEQGAVLIINNEDEMDELDRRLYAVMSYFKVTFADLNDNLHMYSGVERPFIIARRTSQGEIKAVDKDLLHDIIKTGNIKVLIVDPFLETHMVNENNNEEIAQVARMYRQIAVENNCAVLIVHHTRKSPASDTDGHVGNMDSGRGASSLTGVARVVSTLYGMSKKDAKLYNVPDHLRHRYVRLDDAKANLSLASHKALWFHKHTVELPNGDEVGVLTPDDSLQPVEVSQNESMHEVIVDQMERHRGEMTVNQLAQALLDAPGSVFNSRSTATRHLKKWLETPQIVSGWKVWYEELVSPESPRGPSSAGGRATVDWVYGHVDAEVQEDVDPFG